VPFLPLSDAAIRQIVELQLSLIRRRVNDSYGARFDYEQQLIETIAQRCTETSSGARNIEKILSNTLLPELSAEVLARLGDGRPVSGVHVAVDSTGTFSYTLH
jgi:type VI secretion system protein VasG